MLLTSQSLASLPMQTQASTSTMPPDFFQPHCGQPQAPSRPPGSGWSCEERAPKVTRWRAEARPEKPLQEGRSYPNSFPSPQAHSCLCSVISGSSPAQVHIQEGGAQTCVYKCTQRAWPHCYILFQDPLGRLSVTMLPGEYKLIKCFLACHRGP